MELSWSKHTSKHPGIKPACFRVRENISTSNYTSLIFFKQIFLLSHEKYMWKKHKRKRGTEIQAWVCFVGVQGGLCQALCACDCTPAAPSRCWPPCLPSCTVSTVSWSTQCPALMEPGKDVLPLGDEVWNGNWFSGSLFKWQLLKQTFLMFCMEQCFVHSVVLPPFHPKKG